MACLSYVTSDMARGEAMLAHVFFNVERLLLPNLVMKISFAFLPIGANISA
jgi:hypothetical protein